MAWKGEKIGKGPTPRYRRCLEKHQQRQTEEHCTVSIREENKCLNRKQLPREKEYPNLDKPASPQKQKEYRPHGAGIPWEPKDRKTFEAKGRAPMVVGIQEETKWLAPMLKTSNHHHSLLNRRHSQ